MFTQEGERIREIRIVRNERNSREKKRKKCLSKTSKQNKKIRHDNKQTNHNGEKWILAFLVGSLRGDIDARQPAAISGMAVVPAHHILMAPHLQILSIHHKRSVAVERKRYIAWIKTVLK